MSEHRATVQWQRGTAEFSYESYPRDHSWSFSGGVEVPASAAPDYRGDASRVDPEEAFVASIASCHMLTFLALAARKRFVVDSYVDAAVGCMEKNDAGKLAVTQVTLRPKISFGAERVPSDAELARLHEQAHQHCFIANSVRSEVRVEKP